MDKNFLQSRKPDPDKGFEVINDKVISADINGSIVAKAGSMIAFEGDLSFTGKTSAEGGIKGYLKEMATGEGSPIMDVKGRGKVYLADKSKRIQLVQLREDDEITVNGEDILCFESKVDYEIKSMSGLSGASSKGLLNVFLSGPGVVAITTYGYPLVLQPPIKTDPSATVGWSGNLSPSANIDTGMKDIIGQSSGETFQLSFEGKEGFVIVQSLEE